MIEFRNKKNGKLYLRLAEGTEYHLHQLSDAVRIIYILNGAKESIHFNTEEEIVIDDIEITEGEKSNRICGKIRRVSTPCWNLITNDKITLRHTSGFKATNVLLSDLSIIRDATEGKFTEAFLYDEIGIGRRVESIHIYDCHGNCERNVPVSKLCVVKKTKFKPDNTPKHFVRDSLFTTGDEVAILIEVGYIRVGEIGTIVEPDGEYYRVHFKSNNRHLNLLPAHICKPDELESKLMDTFPLGTFVRMEGGDEDGIVVAIDKTEYRITIYWIDSGQREFIKPSKLKHWRQPLTCDDFEIGDTVRVIPARTTAKVMKKQYNGELQVKLFLDNSYLLSYHPWLLLPVKPELKLGMLVEVVDKTHILHGKLFTITTIEEWVEIISDKGKSYKIRPNSLKIISEPPRAESFSPGMYVKLTHAGYAAGFKFPTSVITSIDIKNQLVDIATQTTILHVKPWYIEESFFLSVGKQVRMKQGNENRGIGTITSMNISPMVHVTWYENTETGSYHCRELIPTKFQIGDRIKMRGGDSRGSVVSQDNSGIKIKWDNGEKILEHHYQESDLEWMPNSKFKINDRVTRMSDCSIVGTVTRHLPNRKVYVMWDSGKTRGNYYHENDLLLHEKAKCIGDHVKIINDGISGTGSIVDVTPGYAIVLLDGTHERYRYSYANLTSVDHEDPEDKKGEIKKLIELLDSKSESDISFKMKYQILRGLCLQ